METYLSGLHWTNAAYIDDNEINSEMQYPIKECCLKKIFISLYCLRSNLKDIHTESVFALSLTGNVVISKARGQNEQHSFYTLQYLISIRVWGIASFILAKVIPQPPVR